MNEHVDKNFIPNPNFFKEAIILHIQTASIRPQLLHCVLESINRQEPHSFNIIWHIGFAGLAPDPHGANRAKLFFDSLNGDMTRQWIYSICDDNMLRPDFLKRMTEEIKKNPKATAFFFHQERHDGHRPMLKAKPETIGPYEIDTSMAFLRADSIMSLRPQLSPIGDGVFMKEVYEQNKETSVFLDEVLCNFEAAWWYLNGNEKSQRYVMLSL